MFPNLQGVCYRGSNPETHRREAGVSKNARGWQLRVLFAIPINPRKNARLWNAARRILPGITYETYEETTLRGSTPRRGTTNQHNQH